MSVIDYQDYKIKISNPKSECYILTVVGRAPNNINVNYKALFENMVSICFQTNPDNTGVFHITLVSIPFNSLINIRFLSKP